MKNKIKEVHDYFKTLIINGQYEVVKNEYHTMEISINGEYIFTLWMANKSDGFELYKGALNFMQVEFNVKEKEKAYKTAKVIHDEYKRTELLTQKRKELEELENELK
jgi:hypothetical protein